MTIRMPTFTDLSPEQRAILRDVPFTGTSLVVGPPGTGKTVIAMFRALAISNGQGRKVTFITHSKVLTEHSRTWSETGFKKVDLRTYHSFAWKIWKGHGGHGNPPSKHGAATEWEKDWGAITRQLASRSSPPSLGHVVVDEGQDLPVEFYENMAIYVLKGWVDSLSVFADENQRLDPDQNSTIAQIRAALQMVGTPVLLPLTQNFRNTLPIAKAAASFFVGGESDRPVFPEHRPGSPLEMRKCANQSTMAERVAILASNDRSRSLLVICGSQNMAKSMRNRIESRFLQSGISREVTWYKRGHEEFGDPARLRAGANGVIAVVHTTSMKGLEADAVFVVGLEHFDKGHDSDDVENMNLYVTTSRARSNLEILFEDGGARLVGGVASRVREYLSPKSVAGLESDGIL